MKTLILDFGFLGYGLNSTNFEDSESSIKFKYLGGGDYLKVRTFGDGILPKRTNVYKGEGGSKLDKF